MNKKRLMTHRISAGALAIISTVLISCSSVPASGQRLPAERRLGGKLVEAAFEEQRSVLQRSSAVIYYKRKPIAYGAVVSEDGYILTKNSELYEFDKKTKKDVAKDIMVIIDETRYNDVAIMGQDVEWDIALIKVQGENLQPVNWTKNSEVEQGSWVVANGSSSKKQRRVNVGIISAKAREIDGSLPVVMGVGLKKTSGGVEITGVSKGSGAHEAGIKKGDVLKKIDGQDVMSRDEILDIIREKQPGDKVEVEFSREGQNLKHTMELKARHEVEGGRQVNPQSRNDAMSGQFSARRDSFPKVLQTDILHSNRQTGGPLLLMNGEAVGLVIARANRAESFAIPAEEASRLYESLREGLE